MQSFFKVQKNTAAPQNNKIANNQQSRLNQQKQLQDSLEILKQFDYNPRFGPSMGLTRSQRYERARNLGLNPPQEVQQILENLGDQFQNCDLDCYSVIM